MPAELSASAKAKGVLYMLPVAKARGVGKDYKYRRQAKTSTSLSRVRPTYGRKRSILAVAVLGAAINKLNMQWFDVLQF